MGILRICNCQSLRTVSIFFVQQRIEEWSNLSITHFLRCAALPFFSGFNSFKQTCLKNAKTTNKWYVYYSSIFDTATWMVERSFHDLESRDLRVFFLPTLSVLRP